MRTSRSPIPFLPILLFLVLLAGCSTANPIVSEWRNPAYSSGAFRRVLVGALGEDTSVRRNFEDEFVAQLRAAGVDARPSYQVFPENEKIDEARLKEAAKKASMEAVLLARLIQAEEKTQYGPGYFPYTSFGIFGSHVGASWHGLGGAPSVYRYKNMFRRQRCMTSTRMTSYGPRQLRRRNRKTCAPESGPTSRPS